MSKHWPPPWEPGDLALDVQAQSACVVTKVFDRPGVKSPSHFNSFEDTDYNLYWLVEVISANGTIKTFDTRDMVWLQKKK